MVIKKINGQENLNNFQDFPTKIQKFWPFSKQNIPQIKKINPFSTWWLTPLELGVFVCQDFVAT